MSKMFFKSLFKTETKDTSKSVAGRRQFLAMGAAALATTAMSPLFANEALAKVSHSMIRDPETGDWMKYTYRRAYRYYKTNGAVPPEFRRQIVNFGVNEMPGTIIVDSDRHFLYLVMGNGKAMRYGIGVGRDGFGWAGIVKVGRTAKWPRWTPPAEMVARDKNAAKWAGGMPGGPKNPLGSRALYLYEGSRDTIYRIHGTNKPWSIGLNVSSGCIRMNNDDVADLYERVSVGAKVVVLSANAHHLRGV